jgi:outer membrane protein assembly factor BamB
MQWDKEKNIAWVAELPGEGSATPIVYGNQVFVLSAVKTKRKNTTALINDERAKTTPDAMFYQFVVSSYDRSTGQVLWQRVAIEQVPHEGKHETNTYAAGSPTTDGQRLYFSFGSRGTFCYSLEGELIWKIDLGAMRTRNGWGEAITPTLTEDSLIINCDQEEGSFIAAIDKLTGNIRWKVDRASEVTSWNTPFVTTYEGKQQVIVNGTGSVKSYDANDGTMLWECGGQTVNAIPSPVRFRDSVICTSGYRGALACSIPLNSRGDVTTSNTIGWRVNQSTPYVPSPILSNTRLLYTAGNTNLLSCIDASNGNSLLERMRLPGIRTMYASPILANGHFYFTSREGTIVVVKDNETLEVVATNDLEDVIDASPVAVDNQLFVRSWNKLYCIEQMPAADSSSTSPMKKESLAKGISFKQVDLEASAETSANASIDDMNQDHQLDVIVGYSSGGSRVFFNDGAGLRFEEFSIGDGKGAVYGIAVGDLNSDGKKDIVQARSDATNTIFFNQSLGDEPAPAEPHNTPWLTYPGGDGPGKGKRIVLISAEQEYRSEQSMPMIAKILSQHHGFDCTVLFGVNARGEVDPTMPVYPEKGKEAEFKEHHIPGLEHLASADLVIFFTRLLTLPPTEQQQIVDYIDSGKPLIALRTANHGFRGPLPYKINGKQVRWGEDILGGSFMNHHGRWHADSTRGFFDKDHAQHPILTGVTDIWGDSDVYRTYKEGTNLPPECTALVWGQPLMGRKPDDLPNDKLELLPVAWVKPWQTSDGKTARVFHCTMGSGIDLKSPGLRRLVINSAYWCIGMEESISASRSVEIVGSYEPLESGFNYDELGVKPRPISFYR